MSFDTPLRIKRLREYRNYTQQYMADQLQISQNAYSKMENGSTKMTIERLEGISKVLDVPIESLLSGETKINCQENHNNHNGVYQYIENLNGENKELLLQQIAGLQKQNDQLTKINEQLMRTIEMLTDKG